MADFKVNIHFDIKTEDALFAANMLSLWVNQNPERSINVTRTADDETGRWRIEVSVTPEKL